MNEYCSTNIDPSRSTGKCIKYCTIDTGNETIHTRFTFPLRKLSHCLKEQNISIKQYHRARSVIAAINIAQYTCATSKRQRNKV